MRIGRFKKDFKWNYGIEYGDDFYTRNNKVIRVWFFKFKTIPGEGEIIHKELVKGFYYFKYRKATKEKVFETEEPKIIKRICDYLLFDYFAPPKNKKKK